MPKKRETKKQKRIKLMKILGIGYPHRRHHKNTKRQLTNNIEKKLLLKKIKEKEHKKEIKSVTHNSHK